MGRRSGKILFYPYLKSKINNKQKRKLEKARCSRALEVKLGGNSKNELCNRSKKGEEE